MSDAPAREPRFLVAVLGRVLPCWGVAAMWGLLVVVQLGWLRADSAPPSWDPAVHLTWSLVYSAYFHNLPLGDALVGVASTSDYYPPLVHLAGAAVMAVHGAVTPDLAGLTTADVAVLANLGFLLVLLLSTYALACRWYGPIAGLTAAFLVAVYPILSGQSRSFLLDYPLTALVAWYLALLAASGGFTRRGWPWLLGLVAGLGLLIKWSFAPLVLLPTLWSLGEGWRLRRDGACGRLAQPFGLIVALAVAAAVAGPWYFSHFDAILGELRTSNQTWIIDGDPAPLSLGGVLYYPAALLRAQLFPPFCALAAFGAWIAWRRWRETGGFALPAAWVLGGLVACWLVPNKDPRFTMPLLPALAVFSVSWLRADQPGRWRPPLLVAVLLWGLFQFQLIAFGVPGLPGRVGPAAAPLWSGEAHFTNPAANLAWPHEDLARDIVRYTPLGGTCAVLPNTAHLNPLTIRYYVSRLTLPLLLDGDRRIEVRTALHTVRGKSLAASTRTFLEDGFETLVLMDGDPGAHAAAIVETMGILRQQPGRFAQAYEEVAAHSMPGGETVRLYRRRMEP